MHHLASTLTITLALLLGGCASTPASNDAATEVSSDALSDYWAVTTPTVSSHADQFGNGKPMATHVVVAYTIDSSGRVRDAEVVSFSPEDSSPHWAVTMIKKNRFSPGPKNPGGKPVRTTTPVTLTEQAPAAR